MTALLALDGVARRFGAVPAAVFMPILPSSPGGSRGGAWSPRIDRLPACTAPPRAGVSAMLTETDRGVLRIAYGEGRAGF